MAKKDKFKAEVEELTSSILSKYTSEEMLSKHMKVMEISKHPLFIAPPKSVEDSHKFGWLRGIALATDTMIHGNWYAWLSACAKGEADPNDIPDLRVTSDCESTSLGNKMLNKCMDILYIKGYRITEFIEWIGYSLGIAWFHKPKLDDDTWKALYETFNLDLFFMQPADYFSHFVAVHGQSGHLDYFPTPIHITTFMNLCVAGDDRTASQVEPCVGAAAMFLPSNKLNMVGVDLSLTMVKVSSIQAFIYKPWLLYVPKPIVGIHVDEETLTINRYFEFNTNTRIYQGDSLVGELCAPIDIFEEGSKLIDIYFGTADLTKREIFKYEEYMYQDWDSLSIEIKQSIVKAQARELPFQVALSNPPFNVKFTKSAKERLNIINESNEKFLEERSIRLAKYQNQTNIAQLEDIITEIEVRLTEQKKRTIDENQLELVF